MSQTLQMKEGRRAGISRLFLAACSYALSGYKSKSSARAISLPQWQTQTYPHVGLAAGVDSFRHRVDQVAADAKVTDFDLACSLDENVRRFDVTVNHAQFFFKVVERACCLNTKRTTVYTLKSSNESNVWFTER